MKLQLVFLLCLASEMAIRLSGQKVAYLYAVKKVKNWAKAQEYCKSQHTDLASGDDARIFQEIIKLVKNNGLSWLPIWIGVYKDLNSWQWSINNLLLTSTSFTNWNFEEPGSYANGEECGQIQSYGFWEQFNCTALNPFICFNDNSVDRFIGVSSPKMTWTDAQTYCRTFHTDLASALNLTDNNLLAQLAAFQGTSWFGLNRGTWKWVENTVASDLQFSHVKLGSGVRNCAALYYGKFALDSCSAGHYFICKSVIDSRKQIMKLQVKSEGRVLDPTGQAAILEKIKKKLSEKGLVNVKVTWKAQQDGKIFHKKNKEDL